MKKSKFNPERGVKVITIELLSEEFQMSRVWMYEHIGLYEQITGKTFDQWNPVSVIKFVRWLDWYQRTKGEQHASS